MSNSQRKRETNQRERPNVLVIVLDCVRPDRMSCCGYERKTTPNLDCIAKESTVFENAISVSSWTLPAHASMFTGLCPSEHGATTWDSKLSHSVKTLAETMLERWYATAAVCQNDAWITSTTGLTRGFQSFHGWSEIRAPQFLRTCITASSKPPGLKSLVNLYNFLVRQSTTSRSMHLCKRILATSKDRPVFLFVNLLDAHFPYAAELRSFMSFLHGTRDRWRSAMRQDPRGASLGTAATRQYKHLATGDEFTPEELAMMNELYDVSIHGLDRELGELFGFMQAEGIMDRTCMVITSDHGESIGEHGLIGHDWGVYDCLIKVPLIVRYPEVFPQSTKVTSQVETRRIFHTVIELASRSKGSTGEQDSESLRATLGVNNPNDYAYGEYYPSKGLLVRLEGYGAHIDAKAASMRRFVRSRDLKYVKYENNYCELYDLRNGERRVNPEEFRESASLLNNRLSSWERALRICEAEAKRDAANDSDQSVIEERLRALGYW